MENRYLFRGKRIDNGEWVIGAVLFHDDATTIFNQHPADGSLQGFEVNIKTICQCTGREDMNGKLIWENDEIRCNYETSIVKWEKSEWRIKWIDEAVWRRDLDYWVNESKREVNVVGNIFDNPELLE